MIRKIKAALYIFAAVALLHGPSPRAEGYAPLETVAPGSVPSGINYQGRLEESGVPVTGVRSMTFKLYSAQVGGALLWNSGAQSVAVTQGIFNASLPITISALSGGGTRYIEVTVESTVLSPRERLSAVPYALVAKTIEGNLEISGGGLSVSSSPTAGSALFVSSQTGRVGIGTTNPAYVLSLQYQQPKADTTTRSALEIKSSEASGYFALQAGMRGASSQGARAFSMQTVESGASNSGSILLQPNGGDVGIGTTSPAARLHAVYAAPNSANGTPVAVLDNPAGGGQTVLQFAVNGAEKARIRADLVGNLILAGAGGANFYGYDVASTGHQFYVSGDEKARINAAGSVGIGTTNPAASLDVNGAAQFGSGASKSTFTATGDLLVPGKIGVATTAPSQKLHVIGNILASGDISGATINGGTPITSPYANTLTLNGSPGLNTTTRQGLDISTHLFVSAGNLGVGTTSPASRLHIVDGDIRISTTIGSKGIIFQDGTSLTTAVGVGGWLASGSNIYNANAGNVGIGTTEPLNKLHIKAGASGAASGIINPDALNNLILESNDHIRVNLVSPNTKHQVITFSDADANESGYIRYRHDTNAMDFKTNGSAQMSLDSSGKLLLGAGIAPTAKLHVEGSANFGTTPGQKSTFTATGELQVGGAGNSWVLGGLGVGTTAPAEKLQVVDGNLRISTTTGSKGIIFQDGSVQTSAAGAGAGSWGASGNNIYNTNASNVGIGTTNPQRRLDVLGDVNTSSLYQIAGSTVLSVNGNSNVFVGVNAGTSTTSGAGNSYLGHQAGASNISGAYNTYLGYLAGFSNSAANYNTFVGGHAGLNTTSSGNVFLGESAGRTNTAGSNNVFVGPSAGYNNTTGSHNLFAGNSAGLSNTTGGGNIFLGSDAGYANTSGGNNVFLGRQAGTANTIGASNLFAGFQSGLANTAGASNTFLGHQAGVSNTTGNNNTFVGQAAGGFATGNTNTFIGDSAGKNTTGSQNSFVGYNAGLNTTTGAENVFSGHSAAYTNSSGARNTVIGTIAGYYNQTGSSNTIVGYGAAGGSIGSNSANSLFGFNAGLGLTSGSSNVLIGYQAGQSLTTGSGNVALGYRADAIPATASNMLNIGNLIFGTGMDGTGTSLSAGSVGIGTTSPLSRLSVFNGDIRISTGIGQASRGIVFQDGSVQTSAAGTGAGSWGSSGNDIYSTNSGNVGISSATPTERLTIGPATGNIRNIIRFGQGEGNPSFAADSAGEKLIFWRNSNYKAAMGFGPAGDLWWQTNTGGPAYRWYASTLGDEPTAIMRLNFQSPFGLTLGGGGAAPGTVLDVYGNAQFGSGAVKSTVTATGEAQFNGTGASWLMGNVGIGTTAPSGRLSVHGAGTYALNVSTAADGTAPSFVVTDSGKIGIGTVSPQAGTTLELVNRTTNQPGISFHKPNAVQYNIGIDLSNNFHLASNTPDVANDNRLFTVNSGGGEVAIGAGGNVGKLSVYGAGAAYAFVVSTAATGTPVSLAVNNAGNVGIGTTSPTERLVLGSSSANVLFRDELSSHTIVVRQLVPPGTNMGSTDLVGGYITFGPADASSQTNGNLTIGTQRGYTDQAGGDIYLQAATDVRSVRAGSIAILAGDSTSTAAGGKVTIKSGRSMSNVAGAIDIQAGDGGTSTTGGMVSVAAGPGGSSSGRGGDVTVAAGSRLNTHSGSDAGHVYIRGGTDNQTGGSEGGARDGHIYLQTDNAGAFATRLFVHGNNGKVGIGTTNPQGRLHVDGEVIVGAGSAAVGGSLIYDTSTSPDTIKYYDAETAQYLVLSSAAVNYSGTLWSQNGTSVYYNSGNVGIGTAAPGTKLSISGSASTLVGQFIDNTNALGYAKLALNPGNADTDNGLSITSFGSSYGGVGGRVSSAAALEGGDAGGLSLSAKHASGTIRLYTAGTAASNERMRIDSAGKVGVATASPASKLDVEGDAQFGTAASKSSFTATGALRVGGTGNSHFVGGNVGIGTTAPGDKLTITDGFLGFTTAEKGIRWADGSVSTTAATGGGGGGGGGIGGIGTAGKIAKFTGSTNLGDSVLSESSGNIGIGTASPSEKLQVSGGKIKIVPSVQGDAQFVASNQNGSSQASFRMDADGKPTIGRLDDSAYIKFPGAVELLGNYALFTGGTKRLVGDSNGAAPAGQNADNIIIDTLNDYGATDKMLQVRDNGTTVFTINGAGNVGISSATPTERLVVGPDSVSAGTRSVLRLNGGWSDPSLDDVGGDRIILTRASNVKTAIGFGGANDIWFQTHTGASGPAFRWFQNSVGNAPLERMRLDATGKLGIATASPGTLLDVGGDAQFGSGAVKSTMTASGDLRVGGVVAIGNPAAQSAYMVVRDSTTASPHVVAEFQDGSGNRLMRIWNGGNIMVGDNSTFPSLNGGIRVSGDSDALLQLDRASNVRTSAVRYTNAGGSSLWDLGIGIGASPFPSGDSFVLDGPGGLLDNLIVVSTHGFMGLGNVAYPQSRLHMISPTDATYALIVATGSAASQQILTVSTTGVVFAAKGFTYGADLAEMYPVEGQAEPGDLVAVSPASGVRDSKPLVRKARPEDREGLMGVVSENPGSTLGWTDPSKTELKGQVPLGLAGRVPVKVTSENGPVRPGDLLTASASRPGYAARAVTSGRVIGMALEGMKEGASEGKVLCFVNLQNWISPREFESLREEIRSLRGGR